MPLRTKEYWRKRRGNTREPTVKCLLCGEMFIIIGPHLVLKHKTTAKEYKLKFNLLISDGLISPEIKVIKAAQVKSNGTIDNLFGKKSIQRRFKKNDERIEGFKATRPHYAHRQGIKPKNNI